MSLAKQNTVAGKWDDAASDFEKLMKLVVELLDEFYFHYGKVLLKAESYSESLENLKKYLKLAGKEGKYYKDAIGFVVEVKKKKAEEDAEKEAEEAKQARNKSVIADIEEGMVLVKGGCFKMGDTFGDDDGDEKPLHEVCVDDSSSKNRL